MQSECMPCLTLARVQLAPSSALDMTPWPIVPTRMVPFFAMPHLHERARVPRLYSDAGPGTSQRHRRPPSGGRATGRGARATAASGGFLRTGRVATRRPKDPCALIAAGTTRDHHL